MALSCLFAVWQPDRVSAQDEALNMRLSVSSLWLSDALEDQTRLDWRRRYAAGPVITALGVGALVWPLASHSGTAATITSVATGAALLATSIGYWANADPYRAERWSARVLPLALMGAGASVFTECAFATSESACSGANIDIKRMISVFGAWEFGYQLTHLILELVLPPPDPRPVELAMHGPAHADDARVLAFLKQRDHRRRVEAYVLFPWLAVPPLALFYTGTRLQDGGSKAAAYSVAGIFSALTLGALFYELLRTPDAERLTLGLAPNG